MKLNFCIRLLGNIKENFLIYFPFQSCTKYTREVCLKTLGDADAQYAISFPYKAAPIN